MIMKKLKQLPFYSKAWFQFILFIVRRFIQDRCSEQASSLTYTTLFSVVPMLTVFLAIVSSIKALEPAREQFWNLVVENFFPKTMVNPELLLQFTDKSSNLTLIGSIFLFVTAIMMIMSIETAFNRIWRINKEREFGFMRYWTIISLGPLILGSAFVLSSTLASLNFLNTYLGLQIDSTFLWALLSQFLIFLGFFFLYWAVPNRTVPWRSAFYAGLFTSIVFDLLKSFFGLAMSNFTSYELVYGAFAALPILLLWIYLSWNVILFGVQISYALTTFHSGEYVKRHALFALLDILQLFYSKQRTGETVSEEEILERLTGRELGNAPALLELLERHQFIKQMGNNDYVLVRNLAEIELYWFMQLLPYPFPNYSEVELLPDETELADWQHSLKPLLAESHVFLHQRLSMSLAQLFEGQIEHQINNTEKSSSFPL